MVLGDLDAPESHLGDLTNVIRRHRGNQTDCPAVVDHVGPQLDETFFEFVVEQWIQQKIDCRIVVIHRFRHTTLATPR